MRKGSFTSSVLIISIVLGLSIGVVLSQTVLDEVQAAGTPIDAKYLNAAESAISIFDYGIVFITGSMYMVSVILSFRIRTSPIFFFPALVFNGIALWLSAEYANIFWRIINVGGAVTTAANQYGVMVEFMKNFPLIIGGLNLLLIIAVLIKPSTVRRGVQA